MAQVLEIKIGATLRLGFQMSAPDGSALDLTGYIIAARFSWRTGAVDLAVSDVNRPAGQLSLSASAAQTSTLPEGMLSRLVVTVTAPSGDVVWEEVAVTGIAP